MLGRHHFDVDELVRRSTSGECFICEFLKGSADHQHVRICETDTAVVFLSKYPTMFGYVIVAPKKHLEQVTGDFHEDEYVELQRLIFHVAEAMRRALSPERIYILSIGSQAANARVHWHLAPLPPGVPLHKQQYYALMHEHGVIQPGQNETEEYARRLTKEIEGTTRTHPFR